MLRNFPIGQRISTSRRLEREPLALTNSTTELCQPILKPVTPRWDSLFRNLEAKLGVMVTELVGHVDEFQALVEERPGLKTGQSYDLAIERLKSSKADLKNHLVGWVELCSQGRKAANRALVPAIQEEMRAAYANCGAETGKGFLLPRETMLTEYCFILGRGSFARMKDHMQSGILEVKDRMFETACRESGDELEKLMNNLEENMRKTVKRVVAEAENSFISLVNGQGIFKLFEDVRNDVRRVLLESDQTFKSVYVNDGGDPPAAQVAVDKDVMMRDADVPREPSIKMEED